MRQIIQVAVDSQPASESWDAWVVTTALCDDGTLWELEYNKVSKKREWTKLPDIPQED